MYSATVEWCGSLLGNVITGTLAPLCFALTRNWQCRFEPFLGSLFDRYASRAYTACRTLPYHWWELDHLNPDGVAALRSDTIDERRRPIKLRYFPPPKRLSYLDFLKVLYENCKSLSINLLLGPYEH